MQIALVFFVVSPAIADKLADNTTEKAAVPVRGWILSVYDMPYLRETIKKAPSYGINHIQLSHDIVHHADQIISNKELCKDINELVNLGKSLGLKMFVWTHELRVVPRRFMVGVNNRVDLDNELMWDWLADRYVKLYELVPQLDGVVVSLDETGRAALTSDDGVTSVMQRQLRIKKLAEVLDKVHSKRGKQVIIRDFGESLWTRQGIKISPENVWAMTKVIFGDWQPYCERSITYDYYDNRPLCVEFDLCGEYMGNAVLPWPEPEYVKLCFDQARNKATNPVGYVARIDRTELWRFKRRTFGTPNEINIEMFCRLMQDPKTDPDVVWKEWTAKTYGAQAAPYVEKALRRTAKATKTLYWGERLGDYRIQQHSFIPTFRYALDHDKDYMQTYAVDSEMFLLKPALLEEEMDRRYDTIIIPAFQDALEDIKPAAEYLKPDVYADLKQRFEMSLAAGRAFKAVHTAFIRHQVIAFGLKHNKTYKDAVAFHKAKIDSDLAALEKAAIDVETNFGDRLDLTSSARLRKFAADLKASYEKMLAGRSTAAQAKAA